MIRLFNVKNWISFRKEAYPKDDLFNRYLQLNMSKIANYLETGTLYLPSDNALVNLVRAVDIVMTANPEHSHASASRDISFISATDCSSVLYSEPDVDYPRVNMGSDGKVCRVYDVGEELYNQAIGLSYPETMDLSTVVISVDPLALHAEYRSSGLDYTLYTQRYIMYRLIYGMFYVAVFKSSLSNYYVKVKEDGYPFALISLGRYANGFVSFYQKLLTKHNYTFVELLSVIQLGKLSCLDMLTTPRVFKNTKDYYINITKFMGWLELLYAIYPDRTLDNLMRVELMKTLLSLNMTKATHFKSTLKGILDGTHYR